MRDEPAATIAALTDATHSLSVEELGLRLAGLTLADSIAWLPQLAGETAFWQSYLAPLLEGDVSAQAALNRNVFVARTIGDQTSGAVLQLFVWPPGSATQIHDHSCWGVLHCLAGAIWEERYERLDDGAQMDVARLRLAWARSWSRSDGVTTVLPYEGGIHRVGNPGSAVAISAHIYGPRLAVADGRDYDPGRDYVCERFEP